MNYFVPFRIGNYFFGAEWSYVDSDVSVHTILDITGNDVTAEFSPYLIEKVEEYISRIQYENKA